MRGRPCLMLIDDDLDDQEIFAMLIEQIFPGGLCTFSNNGVSALEKLNNEPGFLPDAIFLDLNMPLMDGLECLGELKKIAKLHKVPIFIFSTSKEGSIVEQCLRLGASGFIKKDHNLDHLRSTISANLSQYVKQD